MNETYQFLIKKQKIGITCIKDSLKVDSLQPGSLHCWTTRSQVLFAK